MTLTTAKNQGECSDNGFKVHPYQKEAMEKIKDGNFKAVLLTPRDPFKLTRQVMQIFDSFCSTEAQKLFLEVTTPDIEKLRAENKELKEKLARATETRNY